MITLFLGLLKNSGGEDAPSKSSVACDQLCSFIVSCFSKLPVGIRSKQRQQILARTRNNKKERERERGMLRDSDRVESINIWKSRRPSPSS